MSSYHSTRHRYRIVRRAGAAAGGIAVVGAVAAFMSIGTGAAVDVDAHQKFQVVTVVVQPRADPPATVTETDKPHRLLTPKASPQILAPRTLVGPKP